MNARRFDAFAVAMSPGARRASRRHVLRGLAALAAVGLAPGITLAFDGGVAPVVTPGSGLPCTSGADCAAGEICLNGGCAPRQAVGSVVIDDRLAGERRDHQDVGPGGEHRGDLASRHRTAADHDDPPPPHQEVQG